MAWMTAGAEAWSKGLEAWGQMLGATAEAGQRKDRRFASPEWSENPVFETIKQSYLAISDQLLGTVEQIDGIDDETRQKLRFATKSFVDAMAPSNFALTNPDVMKKTIETRGENLLGGLKNMLDDIKRRAVDPDRARARSRSGATWPPLRARWCMRMSCSS